MEQNKKKPDKKADKELVKNKIELNPLLKEASGKTAVIAWGRMNPITVGHEKLVNKVLDIAHKIKADPKIYLSHSQDPKKNPLSYDDKIELAQTAFGNIVYKSNAKTIIDIMKELQHSYKNITLVVGQDRVDEFKALLNKYNGKEYNFDSISVVSAGERDPDADDVTGMSASKMRSLALQGDEASFKKGLPSKLQAHSSDVYRLVRAGMRLSEGLELEEAVLTISQRLKRAASMRRNERKIEAAKARAMTRMAGQQKLVGRARRKAIEAIRARVAGEKGKEYSSLSSSEKIQIDKMVEKRKGTITRIAQRLLPTVRKAEMVRFRHATSGAPEQVPSKGVNESFESFLEASMNDTKSRKRFHTLYDANKKVKFDKRFKINKSVAEMLDNDAGLLELIDETFEAYKLQEEKALRSLYTKSQMSGLDFDVLKSIYDEGLNEEYNDYLTAQQHAFNKVNAYIAEGVNDPAIFKAVFLAGGPGSGKSFIVGKTALTALGFKVINSDDIFERKLSKVGLKPTPQDIYSPLGQETREQAKALTAQKMSLAVDGRLGLVIDGTGKDYPKIEKQAEKLRSMGYEVSMIFVNTDLETAKVRNRMRARSLPDAEVETMWKEVQKNIGKFQSFFRQKMFIIDNSEGSNFESAVLSTYRKIASWAKTAPESNVARAWIKVQTVKEEHGAGEEGTNKLAKKYRKDTPNQSVNEAFEALMEENQCALISKADIQELEKFADELLSKYKIDIEFTKHFGERMSDERNTPCITIKELKDFFRKIYANQGAKIKGNRGIEAVIKDAQKALNMPVVIDVKGGEVEVTFKTIMRKKNFTSPNKVIQY